MVCYVASINWHNFWHCWDSSIQLCLMSATCGFLWTIIVYLFLLKLIWIGSLSLATRRVLDDPRLNGLNKQMGGKDEESDSWVTGRVDHGSRLDRKGNKSRVERKGRVSHSRSFLLETLGFPSLNQFLELGHIHWFFSWFPSTMLNSSYPISASFPQAPSSPQTGAVNTPMFKGTQTREHLPWSSS